MTWLAYLASALLLAELAWLLKEQAESRQVANLFLASNAALLLSVLPFTTAILVCWYYGWNLKPVATFIWMIAGMFSILLILGTAIHLWLVNFPSGTAFYMPEASSPITVSKPGGPNILRELALYLSVALVVPSLLAAFHARF